MQRKTILVLYYSKNTYPLRDTIKTHLYCWKSYSKHRVIYINVYFGFLKRLIRKIKIDTIIFHTTFLCMRWDPDIFKKNIEKCTYLKQINCIKIAIPQDEFLQTNLLNDFINDFGITHIFTCSDEKDWPFIYDKIDFNKVKLKTVLTGYLDKDTVNRIQKMKGKIKRDIDIGYRAWKAEYWLGEHGLQKVKIAEEFQKVAECHNLKTDISLNDKDVFLGDDWFRFLLQCKATIGVEGGASVLDKDGNIRKKVDRYLQEHSNASFEETREKCFSQDDKKLGLACISPRHLEACITETCQFLIEGNYNNILVPWRHYIPVRKDYSNISDVIEMLKNSDIIGKIAQYAYEDIVLSGKFTYESFVKDIENGIIDNNQINHKNTSCNGGKLVFHILNTKDYFDWQLTKCIVLIRKIVKKILSSNKLGLRIIAVYKINHQRM